MRPVTLSTTPIDESENGLAITPREAARHLLALSTIVAAVLAGCANYAGIHSDKEMALPTQIATAQSLPSEGGIGPPRTGHRSLATPNSRPDRRSLGG
jgi:hypothetical protein